jgi:hypothetical protein
VSLQPQWSLPSVFGFLISLRHMVGFPGRVIGPSQGLYLHRTPQHRKTKDKHPRPDRDSNPRSRVRALKDHASAHPSNAVRFPPNKPCFRIPGSHGVSWVLAPCSLAEVYRRFRGACCLHHQGDQTLLCYVNNYFNIYISCELSSLHSVLPGTPNVSTTSLRLHTVLNERDTLNFGPVVNILRSNQLH